MNFDYEHLRSQVLGLRDTFATMATTPLADLDPILLRNAIAFFSSIAQVSEYWRPIIQSALSEPQPTSLADFISRFPVMSRRSLQDDFDAMRVYLPKTKESDYTISKTSGSTGQPRSIAKFAPATTLQIQAIQLLEWHWHRRDIEKIYGQIRAKGEDNHEMPYPIPLSFLGEGPSSFQLNNKKNSPEFFLDYFEKRRPNYVFINALTLRLLAQIQISNPRNVDSIEEFITFADPVDDKLRELVFEVFGAKIVNRYSSEEFGIISLQCAHSSHMHVISPLLYVEIVDEKNLPVPVGTPGRVLVTSLVNFASPLIRYEIGDIAQWGESCEGGITWPIIDTVLGRERYFHRDRNGFFRRGSLNNSEFFDIRKIMDFQLILFEDAFLLLVHLRAALTRPEVDVVESSIRKVFDHEMPVFIREMPEINWLGAWKRREYYQLAAPYHPELTNDEILALAHSESLN